MPQRARMISRMVWALGAFRFTSTARMPNRMICTVAPDAYLCVITTGAFKTRSWSSQARS